MMKRFPSLGALATAFAMLAGSAHAGQVLNVYGPGGPAPAIKEAAKAFGAQQGVDIHVIAGPTSKWADQAKTDADVIYSGAENMMSDFARVLPGVFDLKRAEPLYLRPVAILVRPRNPKHIKGFEDLLKPGVSVMAVSGAGQTGLWEDVAGRTGDIATVRALRKNMKLPEAGNSAEGLQTWMSDASIDAWVIWNIWQVANPDLADVVPIEDRYQIYRDAGVVLTRRAEHDATAQAFVAYLKSPEGAAIFKKWGWKAN